MQQSTVILPEVAKILTEVKDFLVNYRTDSSFTKMLNEPKTIVEELDCEILFPAADAIKPRKKKSGVALTQLSLTLHYSKRIFY